MYYTLNLGFDTGNNIVAKEGGFEGAPRNPDGLDPLSQSMTWLRSVEYPVQTTRFTPAGTTLLEAIRDDYILIRLFPVNGSSGGSMQARSLMVFGRRHGDQAFRTPFALDNSNARTIVESGPLEPPNFKDSSWLFPLGYIRNAPIQSDLTFEFRFIVGAHVVESGQEFTFGHDPEMNVGMGAGR